jgi:hypothetical protein
MWDTCKGWWEGKIKVEVDEVRFLPEALGLIIASSTQFRVRVLIGVCSQVLLYTQYIRVGPACTICRNGVCSHLRGV